jgi:hypothetical protein
MSLKVWIEKSLKKKKKEKTYLLTLPARRPSGPPTFSPQNTGSFSFRFLSLTSRSHRSVSPLSPSFLLPLLCLAKPGVAANPAAPGRLPLPFLPVQVDQLRQLTLAISIWPFPFP